MTRRGPRILTFRRVFRSLPRSATEQTAALLTTLLFAVTIGALTIEIAVQVEGIANKTVPAVTSKCLSGDGAGDLISNGTCVSNTAGNRTTQEAVETTVNNHIDSLTDRLPMLSHLAVAATLILFSALGYYESQQRTRLKVRFFNKAFLQATIDLISIGLYYVLVKLTDPTPDKASAAPEILLVAAVFGLYVMWDLLNYRIEKDEFAQLALRKAPKQTVPFGYRRRVSLGFAVGLIILALVYKCFDIAPDNRLIVVVVDVVLISILIAYRIAKTIRDKETHYQGEHAMSMRDDAKVHCSGDSPCCGGCASANKCEMCRGRYNRECVCHIRNGIASNVNPCELMEMLPELDSHAMMLIRCVAMQEPRRRHGCNPCDAEHSSIADDAVEISQTSHLWRHAFIANVGERHEDYFAAYFEGANSEFRCHGTEYTKDNDRNACGHGKQTSTANEDGEEGSDTDGASGTGAAEGSTPQFCEPSRLTRVQLTPFGQYVYGIITTDDDAAFKRCPCPARRGDCCHQPACRTGSQTPNCPQKSGT